MTRSIIVLLAALLAGCSGQIGERVFTVDEFLADDALRSDQISRCRQNPGELGQSANCLNAEQAEWQARLKRMNDALGG